MDHSLAISVFKEIQARPYRTSLSPNEPADNCYFKGIELLQKLGTLGYTVRGRVADTYWDENIFPKEIIDLEPQGFPDTHFFVEIFLGDQWRVIDPSFQPSLEQYGLTIGSWENGKSCFPLTKIYTQEESITYQKKWFSESFQRKIYEMRRPFWVALNQWFEGK